MRADASNISTTSRTAPLPPVSLVTNWQCFRIEGRASAGQALRPTMLSAGKSFTSSPMKQISCRLNPCRSEKVPIRQPCCSRISCARHVGGGSHRCAQLEHRAIVLPADADDGWRQLHELAYAFHVVPTTWKHDHYVVSTGCEVSPHCFGHVPRAVLLSLIRGDRHADHQEAVWTEYVSGPLGELQWLAGGKRSIGNIGGQRQHLRAVCGDDARVARLGYRYPGGTFHADQVIPHGVHRLAETTSDFLRLLGVADPDAQDEPVGISLGKL